MTMVVRARPAAVAGLFYPGDATALAAAIDRLVEHGRDQAEFTITAHRSTPKLLVVPHAGYTYSGEVAGAAYATIEGADVERVVIIGPAHRVFLRGIATVGVERLRTPLGEVAVDTERRTIALGNPMVAVNDAAHRQEHCLEVHLPFLQRLLPGVPVLPLLAGRVDPHTVASVLGSVWDGPRTLMIVSTDLSHYHDHRTAQRLDRRTAAAIVDLAPDRIGDEDACGAFGLRGALTVARRHGLRMHEVALATSADASGDTDRVVGYGAFAAYGPDDIALEGPDDQAP